MSAAEVAGRMPEHDVRSAPVVDGGRLAGVVEVTLPEVAPAVDRR